MLIKLQKSYASIYGAPNISEVDSRIFEIKYYTHCMSCDFCQDRCCSYGVDIDINNVKRIISHAESLEKKLGISRGEWFSKEWFEDKEFPGGEYTRAAVVNGACVFKNKDDRGCGIHSFCLENNIDYHEIKPMISILFPVTFEQGTLKPSHDVLSNDLICLNSGESLYDGVKNELLYYFGLEFIIELEKIKIEVTDAV